MYKAKLMVLMLFAMFGFAACFGPKDQRLMIAASKEYDASLFRQHCAVCHGPEGEGKTLDDGKVVPSLREGEFKMKSEAEIYRQIAEGGNGMTPFRDILTERELRLMTNLVSQKLRQ